jgi:hypothetical protein
MQPDVHDDPSRRVTAVRAPRFLLLSGPVAAEDRVATRGYDQAIFDDLLVRARDDAAALARQSR